MNALYEVASGEKCLASSPLIQNRLLSEIYIKKIIRGKTTLRTKFKTDIRRATYPSWFEIKIGTHLYETVTDNKLHDEQNSEFFQSAAKKKKNLAT